MFVDSEDIKNVIPEVVKIHRIFLISKLLYPNN